MRLLEKTIGWLAPPTCIVCGLEGATLCLNCSENEIIPFGMRCWRCNKVSNRSKTCESCRHTGSPAHVWMSTDYEGAPKELLRIYKFKHQRLAAESLVDLMVETFLTFNSDEDITRKDYLLVPIASATSRVRQRGFDHTALLAKKAAHRLRLEYAPSLGRLGQSRQVGARREQRMAQLEDMFYVRTPRLVKNRSIILVDDVITTGATVSAATKALRAAGAKSVDALVFAKKL
jgi:ComF family protein